MIHIGIGRLEMFLLPSPIWDCQTAELPSSVHRNRGHKTDGEINIGVRRLAHEKAHRYDLRREQLGCATAGGLELYRSRLTANRTRVYVIAAPDVIILLAGPSCQQLLSSFLLLYNSTPISFHLLPIGPQKPHSPANPLQTPTLLQHF